jgi:hypothetical protein
MEFQIAVVVTDFLDQQLPQHPDSQTRFFGAFPDRRLFQGLPPFQLATGKLPQTGQDSSCGTLTYQEVIIPPNHGNGNQVWLGPGMHSPLRWVCKLDRRCGQGTTRIVQKLHRPER